MAFEHLSELYANYYLAKKKFEIDSKKFREHYEKSKKEYFETVRDFELFLDAIGEQHSSDLTDAIVKSKEDKNSFGVIKQKIKNGWKIHWYSTIDLTSLGHTFEVDLEKFTFIKTD